MRILIIIMLLCTTLVPNYLYAISHENYSEESLLLSEISDNKSYPNQNIIPT